MKHFLPFLFLIASCNQTPQNPLPPVPFNGSISYTINDTLNVTWVTSDYFVKHHLDCGTTGIYSTSPNTLGRNMGFSIYTDDFQNATTYYDTMSLPCNKKQLYFTIGENGKMYTNKFWGANVLGKNANDTWVQITSLTDSTITGTFGGRMIGPAVDYTDTLKISNGSFNMNFMESQ
ncbi:MAG: hypothetical protein IPN14_00350 [Bacteroidetes bacterium]|nr:hypothetical protein [Bacteroidota bacterium]